MLDFDLFRRVVDEAGPSLVRIDFFNYGEAFLHKRAIEMCEYIKTQFPAGVSLHEHQRAGVHGGAGAPARALGHRRGDVLDRRRDRGQLREVPPARAASISPSPTCAPWPTRSAARAATCRSSTGATSSSRGTISDAEMDRARRARARHRRRSSVLGADRSPRERVLAALRAGHAGPRRHPARDLGRQQPRQRHPRRHAARRDRRADDARCRPAALPACRPAARARAGQPTEVRTRVRNLSTRPFPAQASYGRRLVRLGAQLCDASGALHQSRFRAGVAAARRSSPAPGRTSASRSRPSSSRDGIS